MSVLVITFRCPHPPCLLLLPRWHPLLCLFLDPNHASHLQRGTRVSPAPVVRSWHNANLSSSSCLTLPGLLTSSPIFPDVGCGSHSVGGRGAVLTFHLFAEEMKRVSDRSKHGRDAAWELLQSEFARHKITNNVTVKSRPEIRIAYKRNKG